MGCQGVPGALLDGMPGACSVVTYRQDMGRRINFHGISGDIAARLPVCYKAK